MIRTVIDRLRRSARIAAGAATVAVLTLASAAAQAQGFTSPFGAANHDTSQPIEVSADSLEVRNADQVAVFRGAVDVRQGKVRMTAKVLEVTYRQGARATQGGSGAIDKLIARGDVIISNGAETAQSQSADYNVATGEILLAGDVLLLQGPNVVQGQRLRINLGTGVARMEGGRTRVKLDPSSRQ